MSEQPTIQPYDSTRFSDGDGIDLHASQLDRLVASAAVPEIRKSPEEKSHENIILLTHNLYATRQDVVATEGGWLFEDDNQSKYTLAA